jgi:hypothetical protein
MLDKLNKLFQKTRANTLKNIFNKVPVVVDKTSFTHDEILKDLINDEHSHNIVRNKFEDLIGLHHSLGRHIRNEYGLWNHPWTPEIKDGVDESSHHPDSISQRLIEQLYEYWNSHPEELTKRKKQVS